MPWSVIHSFGSVLAVAAMVQAGPVVTSVTGTIGADQRITIQGTGFGDGPSVVLFDDFRAGEIGQVHSSDAVIGQWSEARGMLFADPKLSNGRGMRVVDSPGAFVSKVVFPAPASELYTSFTGYVPDGFKFPSATEEEKLPTISALKVAWLLDGRDAYHKPGSDYVLTGYGGGLYRIASNDAGGPSTFDTTRDIGWRWDAPVRWAYWIKGNGTERVGSDGMFQATNGQKQITTSYKDHKPWFRDAVEGSRWESHPRHTWDRINFAGYIRSGASFADGHNFVLDDIYVATGPNAAARIEIGNAPRYADCTKLTLVTTGSSGDSWSKTTIAATIREGGFTQAELQAGYLYVTTGDGAVTAVGTPLSRTANPSAAGDATGMAR